jgi:hypothetical protein
MSKYAQTNTIQDHIDELKRILEQIEERIGLVQSADNIRYVKRLFQQTRHLLDQIERLEASKPAH